MPGVLPLIELGLDRHQRVMRVRRRSNRDSSAVPDENGHPVTAARAAEASHAGPDELRIVDVELIWTRFEKGSPGELISTQEGDDATLSICMVVSWPPHEMIDRAADFCSTGATLRTLIDTVEHTRAQSCVVASRSRIEDGRFVGWLSYPDVLTAQDAFLAVRDRLATCGLTVKLYTRDERVPLDWYGPSHQTGHVASTVSNNVRVKPGRTDRDGSKLFLVVFPLGGSPLCHHLLVK